MYYYQKNPFFKNQIKYFFNKKKIKSTKDKNNANFYVDLQYPNIDCENCKIINQIDSIKFLGNKYYQYQEMVNYFSGNLPNYIPETYLFTKRSLHNIKYLFNDKNKKWIIKPINSLEQRGIKVIESYESIFNWIKNYRYFKWIIQKYIDDPLLINYKKIHLRIYVIIIVEKNIIKCYIYKNGIIYTAKYKYDKHNLSSEVNISSGSNTDNFYKYPDKLIDQIGKNNYLNIILPQIKKIIHHTLNASKNKINCPNNHVKNSKCFKLLAYDFLIDKNLKIYLGEINARFTPFKYHTKNFKNKFYNNILNLVIENKDYNKLNFFYISKLKKNNYFYFCCKIIIIFFILLLIFKLFHN